MDKTISDNQSEQTTARRSAGAGEIKEINMSILIKGIPLAGYEISIMRDGDKWRARVDGIWCEVEEIPTPHAQPDVPDINVGDMISRQAAIYALGTITVYKGSIPFDTALMRIKQLPPAQPERIRGHWICDISWSEGVGMGESYGHYWKCDKCGHLEQGDWGECGCNFCSNCGSDNREVTE